MVDSRKPCNSLRRFLASEISAPLDTGFVVAIAAGAFSVTSFYQADTWGGNGARTKMVNRQK